MPPKKVGTSTDLVAIAMSTAIAAYLQASKPCVPVPHSMPLRHIGSTSRMQMVTFYFLLRRRNIDM
jgi:hypothetical protein